MNRSTQASLSITNSRSPPKSMSIESVMPSNHLILCCPLLLLPAIFPSIRVFSKSQFFPSGGQNFGVLGSASVLPVNIQDWFPLFSHPFLLPCLHPYTHAHTHSLKIFTWVCRVLVMARGIFHVSGGNLAHTLRSRSIWAQLSCGTWDLSSPTRDWACMPCIARQVLNHWAWGSLVCCNKWMHKELNTTLLVNNNNAIQAGFLTSSNLFSS